MGVRVVSLVAPAASARRARVRARAPRVFGRGVRGVGRDVRVRVDRDAECVAVVQRETSAVLRERQERRSQGRGSHGAAREPRRHQRGGDRGSDRGGTDRVVEAPRRGGARPARFGVRRRRDRRVGAAGHGGAGGGTTRATRSSESRSENRVSHALLFFALVQKQLTKKHLFIRPRSPFRHLPRPSKRLPSDLPKTPDRHSPVRHGQRPRARVRVGQPLRRPTFRPPRVGAGRG